MNVVKQKIVSQIEASARLLLIDDYAINGDFLFVEFLPDTPVSTIFTLQTHLQTTYGVKTLLSDNMASLRIDFSNIMV